MKPILTTNDLARALGVQGPTIRRAYCVRGEYLGLKPIKLPNGRLGWPEEDVRHLLGEGKKG